MPPRDGHCDKPTGQQAPLKFIYPQLGEIDPKADKTNRLQQLADLICQRPDGRLTRTLVNRLWQKLSTRPRRARGRHGETRLDPDLLDWLAEISPITGYDVNTPSSKSSPRSLSDGQRQCGRPNPLRVRFYRSRRAAHDRRAVPRCARRAHWNRLLFPVAQINFASGKSAAELVAIAPVPAKWIWSEPTAAQKAKPGTIFLRKSFVLREIPTEAAVLIVCDNSFTLYLNGKKVGEGSDYAKPYFWISPPV